MSCTSKSLYHWKNNKFEIENVLLCKRWEILLKWMNVFDLNPVVKFRIGFPNVKRYALFFIQIYAALNSIQIETSRTKINHKMNTHLHLRNFLVNFSLRQLIQFSQNSIVLDITINLKLQYKKNKESVHQLCKFTRQISILQKAANRLDHEQLQKEQQIRIINFTSKSI